MAAQIRRANERDVPALEIVRRQAIEADFSEQFDRSDFATLVATPDRNLATWIAEESTRVLAAETATTIVGYGAIALDSGQVVALYTAPNYRGEGVGSDLLRRLTTAALEAGCTELSIDAPTTSQRFFEKHDFEPVEYRDEAGLRIVTLTKSIKPDA